MATTTAVTSFPWRPDSTKTASRAIGDLGVGLMRDLKTQRGIHTEMVVPAVTHLTRPLATGCRNGRMSGRRVEVTPLTRRCRASIRICEQPGRRRRLGKPEFGKLRVPPGVTPQLEPLAALLKFWPQTLNILARPPIKRLFRRQEVPLQEIHWPIILGLVASQFIKMS
jgi:hypothetical protein